MSTAMSVLFGEKLFYCSFPKEKTLTIAESAPADVVIPELGLSAAVSRSGNAFTAVVTEAGGAEKTVTAVPDRPAVLDSVRRIALLLSEETEQAEIFPLDREGEYYFGRSSKKLSSGRENDAVIDLPFVSGSHFRVTRRNGETEICDLGSTNGLYLNGTKIQHAAMQEGDTAYIMTVCIRLCGDSLLFSNVGTHFQYCRLETPVEEAETVQFQRSPRIQERLPGGKIEIPSPPACASKPEINWLSTLLPAGVTVAIAVTMALAFQNTMMMLFSLPMTVAGVVVSVVNYLRGKKTFQRGLDERSAAYLKKLDEVMADISKKREAQKKAMLLADPAPENCLAAVRTRSTALWCREPNDADFVSVRLGTGSVPFTVALDCPKEQLMEEDELRKKPGEIFRANSTIEGMPVCCDIRSSGVVGVLGTPEQTRAQLQNMILHLTTHHCYTELKIVCFYDEKDREELSWLADLPHTRVSPEEGTYLASTQEEADELFRAFTEQFREREQEVRENGSYGSDPMFVPYVLFVFFEPKLLKKSDPINRYLFMERGIGAGCLMAAQKMAQLPKQCTEIVTLTEDGGEIYNTARASERRSFRMDVTAPSLRRTFAQAMRPLRCDEGLAVSALPGSYTLYQMLGVDAMAAYDIKKVWKASDLLTSRLAPSAPIGILENGEQILFNSPPTGDNGGAHALVAGTTGSGKSEVLLTLILSLALHYPPEEVGFLVVDFKGDSIAGKLTGLPHLRGVITSLDGEELRRSLVSIGAENKKRLKLFKEYNEKHPEEKKKISDIRDYTEKYRQGKVTEPLPHLFIVVDEFAEMKKQLPDVMDQFLTAAQIGRSLGVHLILATQSPSGVVDNKIRANIFKQLCLKVANAGESRDMIGSELAARIKDPGRAYLKIDDSLQLFQSAYGGGKLKLPDGSESTQLREAVDAIASCCRRNGIQKLPGIFCPPLPASAVYPRLSPEDVSARPFGMLPIGVRDDPAVQFMGEYRMDVFSRNTMIVGSQMMGKTNLLQTILHGAAELYTPEEVNVYILDFASLFLKNFETLPHVGGVVTLQDTEKITNLFRLLKGEVERRRQKFMELGVSTFSAYRESGARDLPQILLLVDDLAAAKAYFPVEADPLLALCKEGLTLGISVAATAAQPVGGMTYLPTFANRIALYNNDASVYSMLFGHSSLRPKELPGRCLVSWENAVFECQSYLAFDSQREIDCAEDIRAFCREQTAAAEGKRAVPIPFVPKDLTADEAFSAYPEAYSDGRLLFGIDYATVQPLSAKLAALGMLAVSGRKNDVRNFQRYLLTSAARPGGLRAEFHIVDDIDRPTQPLSGLPCVAEYSFLPEKAVQMLLQVRQKAEERYARVAEGDVSVLDTSPTLVLMLNSSEAINAISSDKTALESWSALTGKLKTMNVCTVFGALDNVSIPYNAEILKKIKEDRKLMFFEDLGNLKIGELPYASVKKFAGALKKGDGYLILGNEVARVRMPDCPMPEGK